MFANLNSNYFNDILRLDSISSLDVLNLSCTCRQLSKFIKTDICDKKYVNFTSNESFWGLSIFRGNRLICETSGKVVSMNIKIGTIVQKYIDSFNSCNGKIFAFDNIYDLDLNLIKSGICDEDLLDYDLDTNIEYRIEGSDIVSIDLNRGKTCTIASKTNCAKITGCKIIYDTDDAVYVYDIKTHKHEKIYDHSGTILSDYWTISNDCKFIVNLYCLINTTNRKVIAAQFKIDGGKFTPNSKYYILYINLRYHIYDLYKQIYYKLDENIYSIRVNENNLAACSYGNKIEFIQLEDLLAKCEIVSL